MFISYFLKPILKTLDTLVPLGDLLARLWIAKIFFFSGLNKVMSWQSTLLLFQNIYQVPILPPIVAAYFGTAAELILPVLLVLGLGGRIAIFIFFIYNLVCVISFHFLWTPAGQQGLDNNISWGLLLMLLMLHGSGKLSLDYWIRKKMGYHLQT